MQINLTITPEGKKEHKRLEIPTQWPEVTFRQQIKLLKATDLTKKLAIFTGLDEQLIREAEIHNLSHVVACLAFLFTPPVYTVPLTCMGYKIPENLETKSAAQYVDLFDIWQKFKENDPDNLSHFPLICATYAVNPYDFKEADKLTETFFNAPCTEVLAIGNFTLVRLNALSRGIVPKCPPGDTPLNRLRLAMRRWLRRLDSHIRYALWKRTLPISERKYLNGRS